MATDKEAKGFDIRWVVAAIMVPIFVALIGYWAAIVPKEAPGELQLSDIKIVSKRSDNTYQIDFRVSNTGGSVVLINTVRFEVLDIVTLDINAYLGFSAIYDLDISSLEEIGDTATVNVSQEIKPGESDRFGITVIAREIPPGVERGWRLLPILVSNYGQVKGEQIEIWFPEDGQASEPGYFEESKQIEESLRSKATGTMSPEEIVQENEPAESNDPERDRVLKKLLDEADLGKLASYLGDSRHQQLAKPIVESEIFGKNLQNKILAEPDTKKIAAVLSAIWWISKEACNAVIEYRDFALTHVPYKLNDEPDIGDIGLLVSVISDCNHGIAQWIVDDSRVDGRGFDIKGFIGKINSEVDIYKIGKTIKRIAIVDQNVAETIVKARDFDKQTLIKKINSESDIEKVRECLDGIAEANQEVYRSIYSSLKPQHKNKVKRY